MEHRMQNVEAKTGTRDSTYNLISLIYHALQGAETYMMYVQDAEQAGDHEIAEFFRETINANRERAERGKSLLAKRLHM